MQPDWEVGYHPLKHNISKDITCLIVNNDLLTLAEQKTTETVLFEKLRNLMIPVIHIFTKQVDFWGENKKQYPKKGGSRKCQPVQQIALVFQPISSPHTNASVGAGGQPQLVSLQSKGLALKM